MIFSGLSEKLQKSLQKLKSRGKVSEKDITIVMREVKLALLEADVNFMVVKEFIKNVKERALGKDVLESLTPGQQVIKIVNDELTSLMGNTQSKIIYASKPPTVIMLVGLQGAGKTTTAAKLAGVLKKDGKKTLLVACDVYRPAAIKQLHVVGEQVGVSVFSNESSKNPVDIAKEGIEYGVEHSNDLIIIDTAGRLHIDDELMDELVNIKGIVKPHEILLVIDSMTGQDAVNVAENFHGRLGIDGIILTKLDGDTRGGAALSVRAVTKKAIKFVGMGEKLSELEPFHPDRLASRILGMGDMLSLIEKAQANFDEKKAKELEEKMRNQQFDFEDFLDQLEQMKNMGSMEQILQMIPGAGKQLKNMKVNEKDLVYTEAIIKSMTKEERKKPEILNASRRKRIAKGSGTTVQRVNQIIKQFEQTKKMMKQFTGMDKSMKKGGKFKFPFP
ncbi:MAG: signal recognition particle protein [Clostridiales bacterium]|nr:signal recognition particle protein [Clostridiales bacterium]